MWVNAYFIYLAISLVWIWLWERGNDWREVLMRLLIVATIPVFGYLLLPPRKSRSGSAEPRWDTSAAGIEVLPDDGSTETRFYSKETAERERNVVPLEEALLINDTSTRRRVMIDLLKQDSIKYIEVIKLAVSNEDSETSHYAVSAIMEVKRKLMLAMQEMSVQYEENKSDVHFLRTYAEVLAAYMKSGFLDDRTLLKHRYTYRAVLDHLIHEEPQTTSTYSEKVAVELTMGLYAEAEETAKLFVERHPKQEEAYLKLLEVYYTRRSIGQLWHTIDLMKSSPIRFSSHALGIVRYWTREEEHETEKRDSTPA